MYHRDIVKVPAASPSATGDSTPKWLYVNDPPSAVLGRTDLRSERHTPVLLKLTDSTAPLTSAKNHNRTFPYRAGQPLSEAGEVQLLACVKIKKRALNARVAKLSRITYGSLPHRPQTAERRNNGTWFSRKPGEGSPSTVLWAILLAMQFRKRRPW